MAREPSGLGRVRIAGGSRRIRRGQLHTASIFERRDHLTIWLLYGDYQGGQRMISRFGVTARPEGDRWMAAVARHVYLDATAPRSGR